MHLKFLVAKQYIKLSIDMKDRETNRQILFELLESELIDHKLKLDILLAIDESNGFLLVHN